MSRMVYADHAATTPLSPTAKQAMADFWDKRFGNPSSLYHLGQEAKDDLEAARAEIAQCLNARPGEVLFTSGGTESDNWALKGAAELRRGQGKHIITTSIEHHAILHSAQWLEKQGFEVTYLPVDAVGRVSPSDVEKAIRPDTMLISVMAANNEIGTIEPIEEIGAIAKAHNVLFHVDAVQAVGHIPVDVKAWNVDMLSFSGHKFYGPAGIGGLFLRHGLRLPPLVHGGGQERGLRSGTEPVVLAVGMAAALKESVEEMAVESRRLSTLRDRVLDGLSDIPSSRITGDRECRLPGTASLTFEGIEGEALLLHLDAKGIQASSGSACSSASLDPSHVLLSIGLPHGVAHGSLRLSLGRGTTEQDVDYILEIVPQVVSYLRELSPVWDKKAQKPIWRS